MNIRRESGGVIRENSAQLVLTLSLRGRSVRNRHKSHTCPAPLDKRTANRESGENPLRWRHCDRLADRYCHCLRAADGKARSVR